MCQITISRYDCWKKKVLSLRQNVDNDGAETTFSGSAFHIRGAETLNDGTTRRLVLTDDQVDQPLDRVVQGIVYNLVGQRGDFVLNTLRQS